MEKSWDDLKVKALEFKNKVFGLRNTNVSVGAGQADGELTIFAYVHTKIVSYPILK